MKQLTNKEEILILNSLLKISSDDWGSSRQCFFICEDEDKDSREIYNLINGIVDLENHNIVVKLSMGVGGYNQSRREIETYEDCSESLPLARIFAYGQVIEIMEKVNPIDSYYREYESDALDPHAFAEIYGFDASLQDPDDVDEWHCYKGDELPKGADQKDIDEFYKVIDVASMLDDFFGYSSDNMQLGYTEEGELVAYDYGFLVNSGETWSSDIGGCSNNEYISSCIEALKGESEIEDHLIDIEYIENQVLNHYYEN